LEFFIDDRRDVDYIAKWCARSQRIEYYTVK